MGSGTSTSEVNAVIRPKCPALASVITGEAFTTQVSGTLGVLDDLVGVVLEWGDPELSERRDELTA
jgi:hypothetical protein